MGMKFILVFAKPTGLLMYFQSVAIGLFELEGIIFILYEWSCLVLLENTDTFVNFMKHKNNIFSPVNIQNFANFIY